MLSSNGTDGRTDGRTDGESLSPTIDTSSFVTRGRTYGIYGRLIPDNGRTAKEAKTILASLKRDRLAAAHWHDLAVALGSACKVRLCRRVHRSGGFCEMHLMRHKREARAAFLATLLDDVVVDRLVTGIPVDSTKAERVEATRILTNRGRSIEDIAKAMHTSQRAIERYRAELATTRKAAA